MAETGAPHEAGLFDHGRELLAALAAYLHARLRLFGIESREALVHYGVIIGLAVGALIVIVFGYLFLCIGLIMLIARLLHVHLEYVIIGFAILHFLVAVFSLFAAKGRLGTGMFTATIAEAKKDQQWLSHGK